MTKWQEGSYLTTPHLDTTQFTVPGYCISVLILYLNDGLGSESKLTGT